MPYGGIALQGRRPRRVVHVHHRAPAPGPFPRRPRSTGFRRVVVAGGVPGSGRAVPERSGVRRSPEYGAWHHGDRAGRPDSKDTSLHARTCRSAGSPRPRYASKRGLWCRRIPARRSDSVGPTWRPRGPAQVPCSKVDGRWNRRSLDCCGGTLSALRASSHRAGGMRPASVLGLPAALPIAAASVPERLAPPQPSSSPVVSVGSSSLSYLGSAPVESTSVGSPPPSTSPPGRRPPSTAGALAPSPAGGGLQRVAPTPTAAPAPAATAFPSKRDLFDSRN